jgi:hypothetical protein
MWRPTCDSEAAMELPRGITGFRDVDAPPLPTCDLRAFRASCHAAARALGGRVVSPAADVPSGAANYVRVDLELPGGPVSVVLNVHFPVMAFVAPPSDNRHDLRFVDAPPLAEVFRGFDTYTILTATEASEPVTAEACARLSSAELGELRYWRPRYIGEVVFNHWD